MADEKKARKIVYVGEDQGYLTNIQERFRETYPGKTFEIIHIYRGNEDNHYNSFADILPLEATIIYIDTSARVPYMVKLARALKREIYFKDVPIVALLDSKKDIIPCRNAGLELIFVKCGETFDIIHHPYKICFPEEVQKPDFALAQWEEKVKLIEEVFVGYVTPDYIHVEGNQVLSESMIIEIKIPFLAKRVPSNKFRVRSVGNRNLYNETDYWYDLEFQYIDEVDYEVYEKEKEENQQKVLNNSEKMSPDDIKYKLSDLEATYPPVEVLKKKANKEKKAIRKELEEWIVEFKGMFVPKKTKLLIIDQSMAVMRDNKTVLADLPFATRYQSIISEDGIVVEKYSPHVIAYSFGSDDGKPKERVRNAKDKKVQEQAEKEKAEGAYIELDTIFKTIKKLGEGYSPYVIIFNCNTETTDTLRSRYSYQNLLVYNIPMNLKMVIGMGSMVEKKDEIAGKKNIKAQFEKVKKEKPDKVDQLTTSSFGEDRNYLSLDKSYGSISHTINLTSMTESEVTFTSEKELSPGVFKVKDPIPMYITTIPIEGQPFKRDGNKFCYQGLIHGWDESEKKAIRAQVSKIFMRDKAEKEAAEKAEFEATQKAAKSQKDDEDDEDDKKAS